MLEPTWIGILAQLLSDGVMGQLLNLSGLSCFVCKMHTVAVAISSSFCEALSAWCKVLG